MNLFQHLAGFIVRPSRHDYRLANLGPSSFEVRSKRDGSILQVSRQDRCIRNRNGLRLHISHYALPTTTGKRKLQTIIYLHSNNGSRVEGLAYLRYLLELQFNVVLFDFAGSGMSEGEFVTLGLRESQDLEDVVELLANEGKLGEFALWGRSMGAVTALLYCSKNTRQPISCVYDSPFSSLQQLIQEVAASKAGIPEFLIAPLISAVQRTLRQQANVNFSELRIRDRVHLIRCPGLFLTSKKDKLVHHEHCQQLFKLYPAEKKLEFIDCQHHESRSKDTIKLCLNFLLKNFERGCSPGLSSNALTFIDRTESFRRFDIENLNINVARTPPALFTEGDRPAQTSRYRDDDYKLDYSPKQQKRALKDQKPPEQPLTQFIERVVHPKISLTQLKQGKVPRLTETQMRYHPLGSHGNSQKSLQGQEQQQKLPLSKGVTHKKGGDRMLASLKLQKNQGAKVPADGLESETLIRKLHYKLK